MSELNNIYFSLYALLACLITSCLTLFIYQVYLFIQHQNNSPNVEPMNCRSDSAHILLGKWLPKTWKIQNMDHFVSNEVQAAIENPIIDQSKFYLLSNAREYLLNNEHKNDFEYGWGRDEQNIIHIHCNTYFAKCTPEMLRFWFINHGSGSGKYHWYRWWHPLDHKRAWFDDKQIHPTVDQTYVNHTSYVYEYLCKYKQGSEMEHLRIHFADPLTFGFNENDLSEPQKREIVCGEVGYLKYRVQSAKFIHFFERVDDGCLMKSRFWIGIHPQVDDNVPIPFYYFQQFLFSCAPVFMRKIVIPQNVGQLVLEHCTKEMNCLASFLPELWHVYQSNANNLH